MRLAPSPVLAHALQTIALVDGRGYWTTMPHSRGPVEDAKHDREYSFSANSTDVMFRAKDPQARKLIAHHENT